MAWLFLDLQPQRELFLHRTDLWWGPRSLCQRAQGPEQGSRFDETVSQPPLQRVQRGWHLLILKHGGEEFTEDLQHKEEHGSWSRIHSAHGQARWFWKSIFLPSEPLVWLWSSLAWAPHTIRIPGKLRRSGRLSSTLWLLNNAPKNWSRVLNITETKAWMQKSKHFRRRISLTFVQKGFILQRLLASCAARLKFFISMCNSARWHSSRPVEGTVDHRESRRHGVRKSSEGFYSWSA